jgi:hypothetical protein
VTGADNADEYVRKPRNSLDANAAAQIEDMERRRRQELKRG